jgi:hypothetical protein
VVRKGNHYELQYDPYASGSRLEAAFGVGMSKLVAEYVHEVAVKEMLAMETAFPPVFITPHRLDSKEAVDEFNALYVEYGEAPIIWEGELITAGVLS